MILYKLYIYYITYTVFYNKKRYQIQTETLKFWKMKVENNFESEQMEVSPGIKDLLLRSELQLLPAQPNQVCIYIYDKLKYNIYFFSVFLLIDNLFFN